jgi:hypothetical protein
MHLPVLDNPLGFVLYEGPSVLDPDTDIVVIASGLQRSRNRKTGKMIQIWILVKDQKPLEAHEEGVDEAICGDCFHRHARSCYVNLGHGPIHVFNAYHLDKYIKAGPESLKYFIGRDVRFGAYGDPAAVPTPIWQCLAPYMNSHTGYTHSWKTCDPDLKQFCMASCDSEEEADTAKRLGWKPFLVRGKDDPLPAGYFECPASEAAGKRLTCPECKACGGGSYRPKQGMPSIVAHGPRWKKVFYARAMKRKLQKKAWKSLNWV